jgi:hypothetical protein
MAILTMGPCTTTKLFTRGTLIQHAGPTFAAVVSLGLLSCLAQPFRFHTPEVLPHAYGPRPAWDLRQQAPPTSTKGAGRDTKTTVGAGTGVIRGRVIDTDTREPLRRVRVSLSCLDSALSRAMPSDLEGRYEFRQLPAGRYRLFFSKNSYVSLEFGQRRPLQAGRPIELADRQVLEKLDMALPRGGVITGRVTDDLGDAVAGVFVVVMRRTISEGRVQLTPFGRPSETDDLGRFRFAGLSTGTYYVGTGAQVRADAGSEQGLALGPTYFPGTGDAVQAEPVGVRVGEERTGVDFALVPSPGVSLSGTVVDSAGRPLATAVVLLVRSSEGVTSIRSAAAQSDGRFSIANVVAGDYTLAVRARSQYSGEEESAYVQVTTAGADLDGILLATGHGSRVVGRIQLQDGVTPPFSPASLSVEIGEPGIVASGVVRSDWTFEVRDVWPGRNPVSLRRLPAGWALKAVFVGGREALDGRCDVRSSESLADVRIVLSNRPTELWGRVRDETGASTSDGTILVFSEDSTLWVASGRSIATVAPDERGEYRVTGLRPGRYLAVALEYIDQGDEYDPRFLERWRQRATRVELVEGQPVTLDLRLVRIEA